MTNFSLHDLFGPNPDRPDHPDFWKLSEIILGLDAAMTTGVQTGKRVDDVIAEAAVEAGDSYSICYMAVQRSMRLAGVETVRDLREKADEVNKLAIGYMEALIVGARLQQSREVT
jgi:hypothetical protein